MGRTLRSGSLSHPVLFCLEPSVDPVELSIVSVPGENSGSGVRLLCLPQAALCLAAVCLPGCFWELRGSVVTHGPLLGMTAPDLLP